MKSHQTDIVSPTALEYTLYQSIHIYLRTVKFAGITFFALTHSALMVEGVETKTMLTPLKIFCCYAHEDASYFKKLKNHLMPLQFQKHIDIKSEADIEIGDEREKMLQEHLAEARIILLLISPDFIASHYAEMLQAIKYHNQSVAVVIPILIRPIFWKDAPFAQLNLLPTNNKAVSSWTFEDEALSEIAEEISKIVIELRIQQFETEAKLALYPQSLELYEYIIQFLRPNYGKAYENMGDLYYTQGKYEEALHYYEKAETFDTSISIPLRKKAEILTKLQRYKESLEAYQQALIGHEAEWQIRDEMAEIHLQLGDREAALSLYQEILLLQPGMKTYFAKVGNLFFQLRHYEQAQEMYKSAIGLDALVVKHYISLGDTYYKLGKHAEALKAYQQAMHLQRSNIDYFDDDGEIFYITKVEGPDVVDILSDIWYKQGQLFLILHSYKKAIECFDEVKDNTYAHYYKSRALRALDRHEKALEEIGKAIATSRLPCDPRFLEHKHEVFELLAKKARQEAQQVRVEWIKQEKFSFVPESITLLKEFSAHSEQVNCLAITDGNRLFSGSRKGAIREWSGNGNLVFKQEYISDLPAILNLTVNSNGRTMLGSSFTGDIKIWDLQELQETTITVDDKRTYNTALSHSGLMLVSHDKYSTVKLWKRVLSLEPFKQIPTKTFDIFPSHTIPFGGLEGTIMLFSLDDQDIFIGYLSGMLNKIALNPEVVISSRTKVIFSIEAHNRKINDLKLSPDNKTLVSGGDDGKIQLWNPQTGKYLNTLNGHNGSVSRLAIHSDGQLLASQGSDNTIRFWNLKTGELLYTMDDEGLTQSILFSPTEPLLYTGGKDGKIRVWSFL